MINSAQQKEVEKLFELGAHLGHKKSRLHPKARKNVYQMINGTSIIDLTATIEQLDKAKKYLAEAAKEGKQILVVGTKKTDNQFVKDYCGSNNIPFITTKWLPGLLTNFKTIMENVKKLKEYQELQLSKEFEQIVKHERTKMIKDTAKLERLYSGIKNINKRPDIMVMVDIKKEKNAVKEAQSYNIPIVAIADTNANPETIEYPVVANDDDIEVVVYLMKQLLDAYVGKIKKTQKTVVESPKVEETKETIKGKVKNEPKTIKKEVKNDK